MFLEQDIAKRFKKQLLQKKPIDQKNRQNHTIHLFIAKNLFKPGLCEKSLVECEKGR